MTPIAKPTKSGGTINASSQNELEQQIVDHLRRHPRASATDIGRNIGAPALLITRTIEQLKQSGQLNVVARMTPLVAGFRRLVQFSVSGRLDCINAARDQIADMPNALSVHATIGKSVLSAFFSFADLEELKALHAEISSVVGVNATIDMHIVLETVKEGHCLLRSCK